MTAPKMTQEKFNVVFKDKRMLTQMREALEAHFVRGVPVAVACAAVGVTRSGFYAAAKPSGEPVLAEVTVWVEPKRADILRQRIRWQLDVWDREDQELVKALARSQHEAPVAAGQEDPEPAQ